MRPIDIIGLNDLRIEYSDWLKMQIEYGLPTKSFDEWLYDLYIKTHEHYLQRIDEILTGDNT